jgi:ribulose-5-phosphate 4-epimerase/fuculose-1-phosphate aldolase
LAALDGGLMMLNQISLIFYERLAYTDYLYVEEIDQCGQLVEDLGEMQALGMRHHGLLTTGRTVPEAFILMYYLDKACQIQIDAMSSGGKLTEPSPEICRASVDAWWRWYKNDSFGQLDWDALVRRMDAEGESYKH